MVKLCCCNRSLIPILGSGKGVPLQFHWLVFSFLRSKMVTVFPLFKAKCYRKMFCRLSHFLQILRETFAIRLLFPKYEFFQYSPSIFFFSFLGPISETGHEGKPVLGGTYGGCFFKSDCDSIRENHLQQYRLQFMKYTRS